jgi:integrase/recombinase XerD
VQRTDTRLVKHLSTAESRALLNAPDPTLRLGIRDRAMLYLGLTGGLRVSELVGLRLDEVRFDGRYLEIPVLRISRRARPVRQRPLLGRSGSAVGVGAWRNRTE